MRKIVAFLIALSMALEPGGLPLLRAEDSAQTLTVEELDAADGAVADLFAVASLGRPAFDIAALRARLETAENKTELERRLSDLAGHVRLYEGLLAAVSKKDEAGIRHQVDLLAAAYPERRFDAERLRSEYVLRMPKEPQRRGSSGAPDAPPKKSPVVDEHVSGAVGTHAQAVNGADILHGGGNVFYDGDSQRTEQTPIASAQPGAAGTVPKAVPGESAGRFRPQTSLRVSDVPAAGTAQDKVGPEADRYALGSGFTTRLASSFHTAASYLSLPGMLDSSLDGVRAHHRREGYKASAELIAADRGGRTDALLASLNPGSSGRIQELREQYAKAGDDPEKMRAFLRDADKALTVMDSPVLTDEQSRQAAFQRALTDAEAAMASLSEAMAAQDPGLRAGLEKLRSDPDSLTDAEWAKLQDAFESRRGTPGVEAFLSARARMSEAGSGLDSFYAAHPELAAYRADAASYQRFHWQALLSGAVEDGTRFAPSELGAGNVPAGGFLVKGTEDGKEGLWTEVDGRRVSFKSFDGRFSTELLADDKGSPIERRTIAAGPDSDPVIEIVNRAKGKARGEGAWKRHVGRWSDGKFVLSFTEFDDGSVQPNADALFASRMGRPERRREARRTASLIAETMGWDEHDRGGPLARWLSECYSSANGSFESMRVRAHPDGKVHVVYERANGLKDVYTAKFADATRFEGQDLGEALVVLKRSRVYPDGKQEVGLQRAVEYLPDGSRLRWHERYETSESGFFTDAKNRTLVSVQHVYDKPGGGLDWDNAKAQRREDLDVIEDIDTTSALGITAAAINDTPGLGHALKAIGWVGDRGYNGIVGGYQGLIGEIADSPIYRVHGMAGSKRMVVSRDNTEEWTSIARSFGRRERGVLDGDVNRIRQRSMRSQGLQRERMLDDEAYRSFMYRPISDEERGQVLAYSVGAGTYGQWFADQAAESTGLTKTLYSTAGVGMTALETVPQTLPVLLVLAPLGGAAGAGAWSVRGVSLARVGYGVVTPYVMSSWGVNIPLGVTEFVEGVREDNPNKVARGGGQAVVDGLFLAAAAKNFANTLGEQRVRARRAVMMERLIPEKPALELPKPQVEVSEAPRPSPDALMGRQQARQARYIESRKTDATVPGEELAHRRTRARQERVKADLAYSESLEIGRGAAESPVSAGELNTAIEQGSLAKSSVGDVAVQGDQSCSIHSWANHLKAAGVETSFGDILKIVERDLGPETAERARTRGLTQAEMRLVYKAVSLEKGIGLDSVPADRVFSEISRTDRGASMTIRTGQGHHQVYVEGTVKGADGRTYVSYVDSNAGGRTFMPMETFAELARSDGTFAGKKPSAKTYDGWKAELEAYRRGSSPASIEADVMGLQELVDGGETARVGMGKDVPQMQYLDALSKWLEDPANIKKVKSNPAAFRNITGKLLVDRGRSSASQRPDTSNIEQAQRAYKNAAHAETGEVLERYGLTEADVVSHGTSLKGLFGMIFEGKLRATDSFGDGAQYWAAKGTGGSTYVAKPAIQGEPGVVVIMENKGNRMGHTIDYTTKQPEVMTDFLAAVITDGKTTVVLDRAALMTLRSSAEAWTRTATDYRQPGWDSRQLDAWQRYQTYFEPRGR